MTQLLRMALVDPNDQSRESLRLVLEGISDTWLESDCSRYELFAGLIEQSKPDIAIISLDSDLEKALLVIQQVSHESPDTSILAASAKTDGQLILRVIREGACEFLTLPLKPEELAAAITRIRRHRPTANVEEQRECQVVTISGANGGVGSTSLAVNLGCVLAENPLNSVALLDLDMALGDADIFLDLIPEYTLADLIQNLSRLDTQLLRKSMAKHETGLFLLPRPVDLIESEFISAANLRRVIDLMKESFTHLIIDVSKSYTAFDKIAVESADRILLLTQLDLPCLRNAVRMLMNFEESEAIRDKVAVVVNRAGFEAGQISLKKAKETLNHEIFFQIPNDFRTMVDVRNNGVPLILQSPKAAITNAFRRLAAEIETPKDQVLIAPLEENATARGWKKFWPGLTQ